MGIMIRHPNTPSAIAEVTPAQMGVNAAAGDATTTGSWVNCTGYNQASLAVTFVASGDATSAALAFYIEVSNDGATNLGPLQTTSVADGVATLSNLQFSKDTENQTTLFVVDFPLNYKYFRVSTLTVATGHANDDITIRAFLGNI